MLCPNCGRPCRRFGKNRSGSQRYRCDSCRRTYTDPATLDTDRRYLSGEKTVMVLRMILEGNSVRSTERLAEVPRDTILAVMVDAGVKCERFLSAAVKAVPVTDVQADEIWGFV